MSSTVADFAQLKSGLKASWMAGDFGRIANFTSEAAEDFVQRIGIPANSRVLDVACGTGNTAIPAARAGASVTGIDIAPNLLAQAKERAAAEKLDARFEEGDAEDLPSPSHSFDVVLSMFASQDRYGPGQLPAFTVDVVSTSPRTCTFNVGPRFLAVVITAGGARIWSSADCVAGAGSNLTELVKGVPAVLPVSWGRETSSPGCFAPATRVHAGTYHAAAIDGRLVSRKEAVRIS